MAAVRAQPKKEKKGRKEDEQRGVAGGKRSRENGAYGIRWNGQSVRKKEGD